MALPRGSEPVPDGVERFVKQLVAAYKAASLHPATSPVPYEKAAYAADALDDVLADERTPASVTLATGADGLRFGQTPLFAGHSAFDSFARAAVERCVNEVTFGPGTTPEALLVFAEVLGEPVARIASAGGVGARLAEEAAEGISVIESAEVPEEGRPLSADEIAALPVQGAPDSRRRADQTAEAIRRSVDVIPPGRAAGSAEPALAAVRAEARELIGGHDITAALVTLAVLARDTDAFEDVVGRMEAGFGSLVESGALVVAAACAEELTRAAATAAPDERERLYDALGELLSPPAITALVDAMRALGPADPRLAASRRLLALGAAVSLDTLLDLLAAEESALVRRSLVDVVSSVAADHVAAVGRRVTDPRWYVVRNAVAILGGAKSAATIPFLDRTLRHADARVRRESIRALAGVRDERVEQLLLGALADPDAGNVQLALRSLGRIGSGESVARLAEIARGEGEGEVSRLTAVREDAVGALEAIGSPGALEALEALARSRRGRAGAEIAGRAAAALDRLASGTTEEP